MYTEATFQMLHTPHHRSLLLELGITNQTNLRPCCFTPYYPIYCQICLTDNTGKIQTKTMNDVSKKTQTFSKYFILLLYTSLLPVAKITSRNKCSSTFETMFDKMMNDESPSSASSCTCYNIVLRYTAMKDNNRLMRNVW